MLLPFVFLLLASSLSYASAQSDPNPDCTLIIPLRPLSAIGMATPFMLRATNASAGPCNQVNGGQSAFVQGVVLDLATGVIAVYNPLVIDEHTRPAIAPVVPTLPASYVAVLHIGTNGVVLRLKSAAAFGPSAAHPYASTSDDALEQGDCIDGGGTTEHTPFGQVSYCNAPTFFAAARRAIQDGTLVVPPLARTSQNLTCPSTRDFSIVDQDPSDNVVTKYLLTPKNLLAQDTPANRAALKNYTVIDNGSDNLLLAEFVDPAVGCRPYTARDLADLSAKPQSLPALPLDEIQAALYQRRPVAYVSANDPMVLDANGLPDLNKLNAYRRGVAQFEVRRTTQTGSSTFTFCRGLYIAGAVRIEREKPLTVLAAPVDAAVGSTLYAFLVARFVGSIGPAAPGLNCIALLNLGAPFNVTTDVNGVVTDATLLTDVVKQANALKDKSTNNTREERGATINRYDIEQKKHDEQ